MTSRTRTAFPSPDTVVVTDAGLETWLVFDRGVDLPAFAAYPLVETDEGRALLTEYYQHYVRIAQGIGAACLLEAPTWRANPDWAATLGHDRARLAELIEAAVAVPDALRRTWTSAQPFLVGGVVGPRGDGYRIDDAMTPAAAAEYHTFQIGCFATTPVDVVTAMTICYTDEAIGIVQAAREHDLPVVISFTVETDGRLPSGMPLAEAIETTDAATDGYTTHYMLNCAHPAHFDSVLDSSAPWITRLRGLRANASMLSHAELDEMEVLDAGDPADLAMRYAALGASLPALHVVGGCCGTDHRHVEAIALAFDRESGVS
jgi:homocysteine S-methyltransferase